MRVYTRMMEGTGRGVKTQWLPTIYPQLVEIQLCFHLLPWHARFAGIAFNCAAQLDKVFHVFDTLLKPTHLSSERFQGRFLRAGDVTHRLAFDPAQHTTLIRSFSSVKALANCRYSCVFAVSLFTSPERLLCSASSLLPTFRLCSFAKALSC